MSVSVSVSAPRRAEAQEPAAEQAIEHALTVTGGVCLSAESVGKALRAWRGKASVDGRINFVVRERSESKQVQILVFRDGEEIGDRSFDVKGRPCEEVVRIVSLSIAVTLDQIQLSDRLETPLADANEPPRAAEPDAKAPTPMTGGGPERQPANAPPRRPSVERPQSARARTREWELLLAAPQTIIAIGVLPDVGVGLSAGAGVRYGRHVQGVVYAKTVHSPSATFGPGSLETLLVVATAEGCLRQDLGPSTIRVAGCASLSHGRLRGESFGFADARAATLSYWAAGIGGKAELALGPRIAFALSGEIGFPLAPPRFDIAGPGGSTPITWRPPVAGILVSFGPQFEF